MGKIAVYLLLLIVSSCNVRNNSKPRKLSNDALISEIGFKSFIGSFISKDLPFSIKCTKDYLRREVFDPSTAEHKANIFKTIKEEDLKYLHDANTKSNSISFRYAYKIIDTEKFIGVIYIKDSINDDGSADPSWLILNTYTRDGDFINKLKIAGDSFDIEDMFCEISINKEIRTSSYFFLQDSLIYEDKVYAKNIVTKYLISEEGAFKKIFADEIISYYKVDNLGCYEDIKPVK